MHVISPFARREINPVTLILVPLIRSAGFLQGTPDRQITATHSGTEQKQHRGFPLMMSDCRAVARVIRVR
jgi:hypothetical protein